MIVRPATSADRPAWAKMRHLLWPDEEPEELESDLDAYDSSDELAGFVAEAEDGRLIGFAEVAMRSYVEGPCAPGPFLEGIWVDPGYRRRGIGRALLGAAEQWGRERGFDHLGSDALIDNEVSHAWHRAAGFAEIERIVIFGKSM
jgi:aminoglycoside 6'-N-acetyltransferase I